MALTAIVPESDFEALDENLKTFYVQNTDTKDYYLDVANPDSLAIGLQTEKQKLADNNQKLVDQLAKERQAKEALEKAAREAADAKDKKTEPESTARISELEAIKKSLEEALETEQTKSEAASAAAAKALRESEIATVVSKYRMAPTAAANLREATEVIKTEDGNFAVQTIDAAGKPLMSAGQHVSLENLVTSWQSQDDYSTLFLANGAGGMGAPGRTGNGGGSKTMSRSNFDKMALENPSGARTFISEGGKLTE